MLKSLRARGGWSSSSPLSPSSFPQTFREGCCCFFLHASSLSSSWVRLVFASTSSLHEVICGESPLRAIGVSVMVSRCCAECQLRRNLLRRQREEMATSRTQHFTGGQDVLAGVPIMKSKTCRLRVLIKERER